MNTEQTEQDKPNSASKTSKRQYHPRSWWLQHYQRWQTSGMSKTQYCKDNQISLSSFCNWSAEFSATENKNSSTKTKQAAFIEAVVTPEVPEVKSIVLVKTLSVQDITLSFDEGLTMEGIADWIATVKKATC